VGACSRKGNRSRTRHSMGKAVAEAACQGVGGNNPATASAPHKLPLCFSRSPQALRAWPAQRCARPAAGTGWRSAAAPAGRKTPQIPGRSESWHCSKTSAAVDEARAHAGQLMLTDQAEVCGSCMALQAPACLGAA
jgi:hypothetical protein